MTPSDKRRALNPERRPALPSRATAVVGWWRGLGFGSRLFVHGPLRWWKFILRNGQLHAKLIPEAVRDGMREALGKGWVDIIATDHCPHVKSDKENGLENIHEAPFGIPGIDTTSRLMLNAVNEGWLTLEHLVRLMCEQTAKLYNIFPKKGTLQPGSDADLLIVDMDRKEKLTNDAIVSKCGWTTFDGMETTGAPILTMVRGNVVMKDGVVVGEAGIGVEVTRV